MITTFIIITIVGLILRIIKGKKHLKKLFNNVRIGGRSYELNGNSSPDLYKNLFDKDPGKKYQNPEKRYLKFYRKRFLKGQIRTLFAFTECNSFKMAAIPVKNDLKMIRRTFL